MSNIETKDWHTMILDIFAVSVAWWHGG